MAYGNLNVRDDRKFAILFLIRSNNNNNNENNNNMYDYQRRISSSIFELPWHMEI